MSSGTSPPFAGVIEKCFTNFCARVDGAKNVAAGAVIIARDRAERFPLRAFAAARRAKQDEGVISNHH